MNAIVKPRERPILFSAPMVRAILAGTKTQTRRVIRPQPELPPHLEKSVSAAWDAGFIDVKCPFGKWRDRLWVRETHAQFAVGNKTGVAPQCVAYRATCSADGSFDYVQPDGEIMNLKVTKWTPAIYMPRWASRVTLEVTDVRVQRVQEISEDDAIAEGITGPHNVGYPAFLMPDDSKPRYSRAAAAYEDLWDSINEKRPGCSWADNPWVWCVSFKRVDSAAEAA